ncbi:ABC transporter substrate-binding protein [Microcoleus sp. FACHB-1515]|uniref:ABC transporter substrate-binding protein n=1 Tax=Cyanophyceae TaxID=3028117 RepID=UPI0016843AD9|nr:ABC transporter substrate-binding protein [Microcoleus sp. FACHB-1515]MBD2089011.1 ABC transporter substrate-binding protein [Microcoleus sp. FACHB-1515]
MQLNRRSLLKYSSLLGAATVASVMRSRLAQADEPALTMQLDWKLNVQFAGLLLADHLGLYRDRNLNLAIEPWQSGLVVTDFVAENPLTIGCAEQNLILDAQANGAPLKAIATMFQASPYALMCMPDGRIDSFTDLIGKKVGVHVDGVKVMELVKGVNDLANEDIEVVEIPYENKLERLESGEFAAVQCYAVDEPVAFAQRFGSEPEILHMDDYGYRAYAQVIFTTNTVLETMPDRVKAFLEATFDGWKQAIANIPNTAQLVAQTYAEPDSKYTNVEYQTRSLDLVTQYILRGISEADIGKISLDRWQQTADLMAEYNIIAAAPDPANSLDLSFWS